MSILLQRQNRLSFAVDLRNDTKGIKIYEVLLLDLQAFHETPVG